MEPIHVVCRWARGCAHRDPGAHQRNAMIVVGGVGSPFATVEDCSEQLKDPRLRPFSI